MPTIPNLLTLTRLLLTPFVILAIMDRDFSRALALALAAGLTDFLDGYLARLCNWTSDLGAALDPIADKALLCGVYLALGYSRVVPVWLVLFVFGRDVLLVCGTLVAVLFTRLRYFRPSVWGKVSTFLQIATALLAMGQMSFHLDGITPLVGIFIRLTGAATLWSGIHYYIRGIRMLRTKSSAQLNSA